MFYLPPITTLPTVVIGYVAGDGRKESAIEGLPFAYRTDAWEHKPWLIMEKPAAHASWTHIQKYSPCGFMLTWPFCFHIWFTWKYQKGSDKAGWKPGSEIVLYARTPGYRKDTDYGMKWTYGYFGLHWD